MKKIIALGLAVASCVSIACAASSTCEIGFAPENISLDINKCY